ncbi:MAG: hypothetical protein M3367_10945 [Acidobacteriota bacterium]|nr:hypothetical protein [Acidobacteriota bacterium]
MKRQIQRHKIRLAPTLTAMFGLNAPWYQHTFQTFGSEFGSAQVVAVLVIAAFSVINCGVVY